MLVRRLAVAATLALVLVTAAACSGRDGAEPPSPTPTAPSATHEPSPSASPARPSATSTSAPRPSPTATRPAPSSTPVPGGLVIEHGPRESGMVALTFDMGGRVEPALDIMNWLVANRVPATIFMTGAMAENPNTEAGREVLRIVAAHPDLFELGNHSYSHPDFRELSAGAMADELERTERAIASVVSLSPRPWFRPPFGGVDDDVVAGAADAGYHRTVMWDVDTIDWRPETEGGPTAGQIITKVWTNARGGSIVLMHLGGYNTFAALPGIVSGLETIQGLQPVTLSEMFP